METVALAAVTLAALVAFTAIVALVSLGFETMQNEASRSPQQNVHVSLGPSICPCPDCASTQGPMFAPGCPAPYAPGPNGGNPHAGKDDNDGYLTDD